MNFVSKFLRFLTKHSEETAVVAAGLKVAANYMPMERADKLAYMNAVDTLVNTSESIARSLPALTRSAAEGGGVTTDQLKSAVAKAVKEALEAQAKRAAVELAEAVRVAVADALAAQAQITNAPSSNQGG